MVQGSCDTHLDNESEVFVYGAALGRHMNGTQFVARDIAQGGREALAMG